MAKNITSVKWEAVGLPPGLTINENTGVISGTPNVEPPATLPATFTPMVKVTTNYGSDEKQITIYVTIPESWKPLIDPDQVVNAIEEEAMTPYTVTGQNVTKTV